MTYDYVRPLLALLDNGVRFVVIGGVAGVLHGAPLITTDLDVCYARDEENLARLAAALRELGARLRGRNVPDALSLELDVATLRAGDHFTLATDAGPLDLLGSPAGAPGGYAELARTAARMSIGVAEIQVAALDDLIRMKRAAGRPKDLAIVEELGALRDEIDRRAVEERRTGRRRSS